MALISNIAWLTAALSFTNCAHAPIKEVDKTFGMAMIRAVFLKEILKGIGFSNPALLIPHCSSTYSGD